MRDHRRRRHDAARASTCRSPPHEIADSAIAAAKAGAAVVHIHVRDPDTGAGARDPELYAEVVERIRESGVDVVINLTAGMGGDLVLGGAEQPLPPNPDGTDMAGATERLAHVRAILPEICTLDCGTMNFASGGDYIMVNTPGTLKAMARQVQELGVRPELEVFDTGHLVFVKELIRDGLLDDPIHDPAVHGHRLRRARRPHLAAWPWSTCSPRTACSRRSRSVGCSCPYVAMAALAGGNVRVGLEDNLYLGRGQLATNADLAAERCRSSRAMNVAVMSPAGGARQARTLVKR